MAPLRALTAFEVFEEIESRRFALTPLGAWLRSDVAGSLRPAARFYGGEYPWRTWGDLLHCVRTGEAAAPHALRIASLEAYFAQHATELAIFQAAMTTYAVSTMAGVVAHDFSGLGTIIDVGGGQGMMLAALVQAHPALRGILFDLPAVVQGAAPILESAGVAQRCDVVAGDAFDAVPTGGDLYLLSRVIHDWDDAHATAILRNCRRAARQGTKLLLVESVLPTHVTSSWTSQTQLLSDLNMLVLGGGRERTTDDFGAILAASGWELTRVTPADGVMSLVEGIAV